MVDSLREQINTLESVLLAPGMRDKLDRAEALALEIAKGANQPDVAELALRVSAAASLLRDFPDHLEYLGTLDAALRALHGRCRARGSPQGRGQQQQGAGLVGHAKHDRYPVQQRGDAERGLQHEGGEQRIRRG